MKSKSVYIILILFLTFVVISSIIDIDKYIPSFSEFFPFIWILFLIFDLHKSKKYLKNIPENEIRIRSKNDSYFSVAPFILGVLFCSISILFIFQDESRITVIFDFIFGIVFIFKGILFIPSALIKNENGILYFENGTVSNTIKIEKIEKVILNENKIEFNLNENINYIFSHLELNLSEIEILKIFLRKNINTNII